jgi:hypothetical protein
MTLQEAKDQVAKKLYYQNWDDFVESESDPSEIPYRVEEAAELYKNNHVQAMQEDLENEIKLLKEIRYRADSVLYEGSGHKELGDALRQWDSYEMLKQEEHDSKREG